MKLNRMAKREDSHSDKMMSQRVKFKIQIRKYEKQSHGKSNQ